MVSRLLVALLLAASVYSYHNGAHQAARKLNLQRCKDSDSANDSEPSTASTNKAGYTDEDLYLKRGTSRPEYRVIVPEGYDVSMSEKERATIEKKQEAQQGNSTKSDLDILREEMRALVERMAKGPPDDST